MYTLSPENITASLGQKVALKSNNKNTLSIVLLSNVPKAYRAKMVEIKKK